MSQAAFGGVVVRWDLRFGYEDEEFLDVALDASAQLGLCCRGVVKEGLADDEQLPFQR